MLEVCVDCVESAENAEKGGACRLELCANLSEGGITPSLGLMNIVKQIVSIPVHAMIRPRGGDFLYSDQEFAVMAQDITALKQAGADGFVLGILSSDGTVDAERCQELIDMARPLPVTFHRAIDMCTDIQIALEDVIRLGCERVLTSGGELSALEGAPTIRRMVELAGDRAIIMPGGGITERNIRRILDDTGAREFHASARVTRQSRMLHRNSYVQLGACPSPTDFLLKITDKDRVKTLIKISKEAI